MKRDLKLEDLKERSEIVPMKPAPSSAKTRLMCMATRPP